MTAHTATPEEKPRLWQLVTDVWPNYDVYQSRTERDIPDRRAVAVVTSAGLPPGEWVERAVERSAAVQRSRLRIAQQVRQMLEAARRLIDTKGDEFTTQELCAEAGVALQTFYRYFASKDELLLAVIGDAMTDACERWADGRGRTARSVGPAEVLPHVDAGAARCAAVSTRRRRGSSSRRAGSYIATTPRNSPRPRSRSSTCCGSR